MSWASTSPSQPSQTRPGSEAVSLADSRNDVATTAEQEEETPESKGEETDFLDTVNEYYSIYLDKNLEPDVEEKVVPIWVTSIFCGALCGPLWIPVLFIDDVPEADYFLKEALIAIAVEYLTTFVGGATSVVGIGAVLITANLFYLTPIGIINGYDRALKKKRAKLKENPPGKDAEISTSSSTMAY